MPSWEYFPFATNRTEPLELVESEHRQPACRHASEQLNHLRTKRLFACALATLQRAVNDYIHRGRLAPAA